MAQYLESKKLRLNKGLVVGVDIYKGEEMNFGVHTQKYSIFYNGTFINSDTNKAKAISMARIDLKILQDRGAI